ncbi:MAG: hypothetical protein ACOZCO_16415 [Bacteroidota bacterium]
MKKVFILFLLAILALPSCRKAENDPFFSIHSRKSRLTGKWKVTGGYLEQTEQTGTSTNLYYKVNLYENSAGVYASISNAWEYGYGNATMHYEEKFEFERDGSFTHYLRFDDDTWDENGQWNFTDGVGRDRKNKSEVLLMYNSSVTSFYGEETWDGEVNSVIYDLLELRNDRITIEVKFKYYDQTDGSYLYYTEHKILEKDE